MGSSKKFVTQDVAILVLTVLFFGYSIYRNLQSNTSLLEFFLFEGSMLTLLQIGQIYYDIKEEISWVLSLRTASIILLFGLALMSLTIGLFEFVFILYFCIVSGMHLCLLVDTFTWS